MKRFEQINRFLGPAPQSTILFSRFGGDYGKYAEYRRNAAHFANDRERTRIVYGPEVVKKKKGAKAMLMRLLKGRAGETPSFSLTILPR